MPYVGSACKKTTAEYLLQIPRIYVITRTGDDKMKKKKSHTVIIVIIIIILLIFLCVKLSEDDTPDSKPKPSVETNIIETPSSEKTDT